MKRRAPGRLPPPSVPANFKPHAVILHEAALAVEVHILLPKKHRLLVVTRAAARGVLARITTGGSTTTGDRRSSIGFAGAFSEVVPSQNLIRSDSLAISNAWR